MVGLTALGSFAIPSYEAALPTRMLRFPMVIVTGMFGITGSLAFLLMIFAHRRRENPASIAQAATAAANASLARGCWRQALAFAQEGVAAAQRSGQRFYGYVNAMIVGLALIRLGDVAAGIDGLEELVAMAEAEGIGALLDALLLFLSQGYLAAQRFESAEQAALRGRQIAAAGGARYMGYRIDRALGEVYAATGQEADTG